MTDPNAVIYPHRIYLLDQLCDVCSKPSSDTLHVDKNPFVGYVVCGAETCVARARANMRRATISMSDLKQMLGDTVRVVRTSGRLEDGWSVYGAAYKEGPNAPFLVRVRKGNEVKCVDLSQLNVKN